MIEEVITVVEYFTTLPENPFEGGVKGVTIALECVNIVLTSEFVLKNK